MRTKNGRPLSSPLLRQNRVDFRLNDVELNSLKSYAQRYEMSVSDVIRECLETLAVTPSNPLT